MIGRPHKKTLVENALSVFGTLAVAAGLFLMVISLMGAVLEPTIENGRAAMIIFAGGFLTVVTGLLIMGAAQALGTFRLMAHNQNISGDY